MRLALCLAASFLPILAGTLVASIPLACPYCGRPVSAEVMGPPITVTIDNHPSARPQSGLNQACLVFEAPVEGGITRFLAVYGHGQAVPEIGPVRSMRPYFVVLAKSLGAVLAHCGGSPEAYALAPGLGLPHLDEIRDHKGFWRDPSRKMPHNLYTSTAKLQNELTVHPFAATGLPEPGSFGLVEAGEPEPVVTLPYAGKAGFVYEPSSGTYLRTLNGATHAGRDGRPIKAGTVIVVGLPVTVLDKIGRVRLDFGRADPCLLYAGGRVVPAYWPGATGRVRQVVDAAGTPIPLKPGTIWFALVPAKVSAAKQPVGTVTPVTRVKPVEW